MSYPAAIVNAACPSAGKQGQLCLTGRMHQTAADVGKKFRARITAVDLAGNRRRAPGKRPVITWSTDNQITVCIPIGKPGKASKQSSRHPTQAPASAPVSAQLPQLPKLGMPPPVELLIGLLGSWVG